MNIRPLHLVLGAVVLFGVILVSGLQVSKTRDAVDRVTEVSGPTMIQEGGGNQIPTESAFGIDPRPVRIGFDGPNADSCGGYGEITGLNPDGDNFLSVRSAPDAEAEELDRLTSGTEVSMCETEDGWIGIVYEASGETGTGCGVGSPVGQVRDYDGSCRSGWISQRFVELIAG